MERHQKGEQFRILDPATYPEEPMGPQRLKLLVVGLLLSLGVAAGGVILWEKFLDTSFHSVEELEMVTSTAVLASIPKIVTAQGRRDRRRQQWLRVAAFAVSLLLVAAVVRQVAVKNEQLVMKLTKPAGTLP
jgi:hypothetical protein